MSAALQSNRTDGSAPQKEEILLPDLVRVGYWDRYMSRKKLIFCLICLSEKAILMSECLEDLCLVKSGSSIYFGDYGTKELIIICTYFHFSHCNGWNRNYCSSPKEAGQWRHPCDGLWLLSWLTVGGRNAPTSVAMCQQKQWRRRPLASKHGCQQCTI